MSNVECSREENGAVRERFELSTERIRLIRQEETVGEPFCSYFRSVAGFLAQIEELLKMQASGRLKDMELPSLKELNRGLYSDVLPQNYDKSYANPQFAVDCLGEGYGQLLSFLYTEIRGDIVYAFEARLEEITILSETFIEIYNLFEEGRPEVTAVRDVIYWYVSDYTDITVTYRLRESLDPSLTFAKDIIMGSDLSDLRYLYQFGEYISENELAVAAFLNSLPQVTVDRMGDTLTEGYCKGFQVMRRDLSKKRTVLIRYAVGFERMIKRVVENFGEIGLEPIFCRAPISSINRNPNRKVGYFAASPNRQYEYDHRYDSALYYDKALKDRKLSVLKVAYEQLKKEASVYAGPALLQTFGETGFQPVNREANPSLTPKQEKLIQEDNSEAARIQNEYIPGDEVSFSIIAFPVPEIGPDFADIFRETIEINTLDYELYKEMQQVIIDVLDQADHVVIRGKGSNETDLAVKLHTLTDPDTQTNFENCLADVNIPLGEIFTSPVLAGTSGLLNVGTVFIEEIQFKNLKMWFRDGMVTRYSCDNFSEEIQGQKMVRQMILRNHETLPMGEFAIGTNTTAYAMAQKYGILDKLPILIVEKMGPHFAVGDTCYNWSEDVSLYNPNGKELIAKDNEVSILRRQDVSKAYFNCHTDITIPYDELSSIEAVKKDGQVIAILTDGKFVLKGVEALNKPLT